MEVIARYPECRVQDIAREVAITVGGVSKLVDRIEACGHCRRRANPQDRRSSIIELISVGRRLLAKATTVFENELATSLDNVVPEQETEQFIRTLRQLRAAISSRRTHT
jgi:MarR family transcriptional regulator, organic hydroperoxide resistance regulator